LSAAAASKCPTCSAVRAFTGLLRSDGAVASRTGFSAISFHFRARSRAACSTRCVNRTELAFSGRVSLVRNADAPQQRRIELVEVCGRKLLKQDVTDVAAGSFGLLDVSGDGRGTVLTAIGERRDPAFTCSPPPCAFRDRRCRAARSPVRRAPHGLSRRLRAEILGALALLRARTGLAPLHHVDHVAGRKAPAMHACHSIYFPARCCEWNARHELEQNNASRRVSSSHDPQCVQRRMSTRRSSALAADSAM
jgi:hypothetical protein